MGEDENEGKKRNFVIRLIKPFLHKIINGLENLKNFSSYEKGRKSAKERRIKTEKAKSQTLFST